MKLSSQLIKPTLLLYIALYTLRLEPSNAVTLYDAVGIAQVNNRNIKIEQIRLNAVKTEKTKAIAEFLPNISANAGYGQRNSYFEGQIYDRSTKQRTEEIKFEQPIFDGLHSVSKYREANYRIKSGSAKASDKIQEVSFLAVQGYCNLFRYQELIKLQQENKELSAKFLELIKRRKEVKIIDEADIIKFTYEASLSQEKYLDSLNRLNKAKFDYQNIVGQLHENLAKPEIPSAEIPSAEITQERFNKENALEIALANNHNIKSYHYNYLASKASYNAEKSNFLPKVSLSAEISKQDRVVYLNNQDLNSRSISLNVAVPIFQKGIEYANVNKAKYDRDLAKEEYEIIRENIIKEFSQTLEEYNFISEMNKTNKKLLDLAQSRAEIFVTRSQSKVEDPIEVIRVKIEANDRMINYINSQMDLVISYYKIKYFLGEI